ncbi:MAG: DUF937 domain-containing protein, partial [Myxococcota bacterium]
HNTASPEGAQALASAVDRDHVPNLESQIQGLGSLLGGAGSSGGSGSLDMLGGLMGSLMGQKGAPSGGGGLGGMLGAAMATMASGNASGAPKALDGAGILGHILGGRRGAVESGVAQASGLDASAVAKLLPALAPILMSALGTIKSSQNLDASGLSNVIRQEQDTMSTSAGGKSITSMFDLDNDGSVMDEVASLGGMLAQSGILNQLFK